MYSMAIDRKDRLWAVDSDNNRIFMLPLTNVTTTEPWNVTKWDGFLAMMGSRNIRSGSNWVTGPENCTSESVLSIESHTLALYLHWFGQGRLKGPPTCLLCIVTDPHLSCTFRTKHVSQSTICNDKKIIQNISILSRILSIHWSYVFFDILRIGTNTKREQREREKEREREREGACFPDR